MTSGLPVTGDLSVKHFASKVAKIDSHTDVETQPRFASVLPHCTEKARSTLPGMPPHWP